MRFKLNFSTVLTLCSASLLSAANVAANEFEFAGEAGVEQRYFFEDALLAEQERYQASVYLQPEFYYSWNDGEDRLVIKPFARFDQHDSERTHFDIREFNWLHLGETWEVVTGVSKVTYL